MRRAVYLILLASCGFTACTYGDRGSGNARIGFISEPPRAHEGELSGPGVAILDDWLKNTREGRAIVTMGFAEAHRGLVSEDVAHRANIWFRRYADHNRDMTITDAEIRTALVHAAGRWTRRSNPRLGPDR
jgi:hypothetical protein